MNCQDMEPLMAEALGGELPTESRAVFEAHLQVCPACREAYEANRRTLVLMRELPKPAGVEVHRDGDRLVIQDAPARMDETPRSGPARMLVGGPFRLRAFRFAASLLLAFFAGYALNAGITHRGGSSFAPTRIVSGGDYERSTRPGSLRSALRTVYAREPGASTLAKALIALGRVR